MAKILFIEDEDFLLENFILALQDREHEVAVVRSGEEALGQIKKDNQDFDIIVIDVMLPRGNHAGTPLVGDDIKTGEMGLEVLRQLRLVDRETPVIILTAVTDDDSKAKILNLNVVAYLDKPVSFKIFLNAVEKALSHRETS